MEKSEILRQYSKQEHQPERDDVAEEIRQSRSLEQSKRRDLEQLMEKDQALKELNERLEDLSSNFLSRWTNAMAISKIRKDISQINISREETENRVNNMPEFEKANQILERFYQRIKDDWESRDISEDEMRESFSIEKLRDLNLTDYLLLLRKSRSELLTHVTRQGVRDHSAMQEHSAGLGAMHNGFKDIMASHKISSVIGELCQQGEFEECLEEFFDKVIKINGPVTEFVVEKGNQRYWLLNNYAGEKKILKQVLTRTGQALISV